ncbi:MAG: DUF188 domain-containing protein [Spirochaetaceae bacterium]|jgi:uncharacterized protein YaiI (UPF0178 family)|nr:DUF188 domain-containing protein [Spirochaetaceae bacterium]
MKILVDADSCPALTRKAIIRASERTGITAIFAANRPIPDITGETVVMELCPNKEGAADDRIVALACSGDLAITRDLPLASRLVKAEITTLDDRGRLYTPENIHEYLSIRNFMLGLAENGLGVPRNAHYGQRELKTFADSFDRVLSRLIREKKQ